jgi:L-serine dehydratase
VDERAATPIQTTLDELFKIGPGPSSSHTMGPMRITYDFYRRASALPAQVLARATDIEVRLYGSLSATGRGHGTDRASLAGLLGQSPAACPPELLDGLAANPTRLHPVVLGPKTLDVGLANIVFENPVVPVPHPNTMSVRLLAGRDVLYEREYYSVGGGFIEWQGYVAPGKGRPAHPYASMAELRAHVVDKGLPLDRVLLDNEMSVSGCSAAQVWASVDQVIERMIATVDDGLRSDAEFLPGPIRLHSKARTVFLGAQDDTFRIHRGVSQLSSYALAAAEENARGHVVVTAPTAGSAGVMPALVKALRDDAKVPLQRLRGGVLAAAAIGYLCKHNATLSGAEGGCQAEIGVASAMTAALCAQVYGGSVRMVENAAESALEHHLGLTCDPVGGFVQVPCIERCAFGAVKAFTAFCIASEGTETRHRIDLDTTIAAMAMTARDMNRKYKETSEAGLAALVIC